MKRIVLVLVLAAAGLMAASCSKEHKCKCVTTDVADDNLLKIMMVDRGLSCESISEMGYEEKYTTENGEHSLRRTGVHTYSCRDYDD